jgi:prophage tail gpP-like protein
MTTTTKTTTPRRNHVAAIVEHDGNRLGHVIMRGRTFTASRKTGTDTDMRMMATGFHTIDAAAAWIAKSAA